MSYEPTTWTRGTKITASKLNNIERGVESVNSGYTPTTWVEGDIVTATKLNNIEQGIANASGGGGGGDFSKAEVTIIAEANLRTGKITLPELYEANELGEGAPALIMPVTERLAIAGTFVKTIALYKGYAYVETIADTLTVSGNATYNSETEYCLITGNCTLHFAE